MSRYKDLYKAFLKRYASELSKQIIQEKCNTCWKSLKDKFRGTELNNATDKKILELKAETRTKKTSLLRFFVQVSKKIMIFSLIASYLRATNKQ